MNQTDENINFASPGKIVWTRFKKDKLALVKGGWIPRRAPGEGRPTKKERREMDRVLGL